MRLYLTDVGQALLYKAQGGKQLKFTKFKLGDGILNGQAIQTLTNLISEKMLSGVRKYEIKNNKVVLGMSFSNSNLETGFYFRELGIFAEDPDTKQEVLYMYGNAGETADYIDDKNGKAIEEYLDLEFYISNVENITAVIDSSLVYVTKQELTDLDNKKVDKEDMQNLTNTKADKKKTWNVTIPITGWTSVAPYTITIPVEGIKVGDEPNMYLIKSTDAATRKVQQEAFNKISDARTADNIVTIYCDEEMIETAIEVKLEVLY